MVALKGSQVLSKGVHLLRGKTEREITDGKCRAKHGAGEYETC